ncbi:conserved protein of unknown function (plasmid) [Thiomonas sp. Bio17B3]|nr:conserved protein of unknown function [Thiomonas sp. Sup16B3]VDY11433.1 conserved protein of unknown function [Thiomonas sp. Bio17B3]
MHGDLKAPKKIKLQRGALLPKRRLAEKIPLTECLCGANIPSMAWEIEYTDEFEAWWVSLSEAEQSSVAASVGLLEDRGPNLRMPHSSGIQSSRHGHMRELRTQHDGRPYRTLYAFDPRRTAILLIGADKTGDDAWYEEFVPKADTLYDEHLEELKREQESGVDG